MCCKLQGVCYIVSKRHALRSTNSFKLRVSFHPPSVKSALQFIANGTQPHFAKRWTVGRANNLSQKSWGRPSWKKLEAKKLLQLFGFRRLRGLMANICSTKRDIDNQTRALKSTKGLLRCPKISWTLVHKRLKTGPKFLPTITILLCSSLLHTLYEALTWRSTATLDETALGLSAAQIWGPKRC